MSESTFSDVAAQISVLAECFHFGTNGKDSTHENTTKRLSKSLLYITMY